MKDKATILAEVWRTAIKYRGRKRELDTVYFINILKEIEPDLPDEEYIDLLRAFCKKWIPNGGLRLPPAVFNAFVDCFVATVKPSSVLVPFATGFDPAFVDTGVRTEYHFCDKGLEAAIKAIADIKTIESIPQTGSYDLIFSALPLGMINKDDIACQVTEQVLNLLSEEGYCVFSFSRSIAKKYGEKWLRNLEKQGYYCNAMVEMPKGTYAPQTNVESEIVIFSKRKSEKRFAALLSVEESIPEIINNFIIGKASHRDVKLGVFLEEDTSCYSEYDRHCRLQALEKSVIKTYNAQLVRLSQIGKYYSLKHMEAIAADNAVFIPKLGTLPVIIDISEAKKSKLYYQVLVNQEIMLPRFLAFFLNSEDGANLRQLWASATKNEKIHLGALLDMNVPCPSIETQSLYIDAYEKLEVLRIETERLKYKLLKAPAAYQDILLEMKDINNTGDRMAQWIETLPYPIATILKRYTVEDNPSQKQETILYFFEAYSIFQATILCAALERTIIDKTLFNNVDLAYFEKASFGNWVVLDRTIGNLFLARINSDDDDVRNDVLASFGTNDHKLIKLLCNKKVCNILEQASVHRNNWRGHSGLTSDAIYKDHISILDSELHQLQDAIKDLFERFRIIRQVGLSLKNGIFENKVEILMGSNPIFGKETIKSTKGLDEAKLYLQMIDTGETLELPPLFIMKDSPANVKNACYFYNRIVNDDSKYISYHYAGEPEDIETGKVAFEYLESLLSNQGFLVSE